MRGSFFGSYGSAFSKYATFEGRARRLEFWAFSTLNVFIAAFLGVIENSPDGVSRLASLFWLFILLPSIAVAVRRLHDIGRTGWWWLIWFIPVIGWIVLIIFYATKGDAGDNQYGPDPKAAPVPELPPNA
ncbi:MAG: DUF805 domain-containing protein [Proteobacteria bacterium]|nr:DUF805 domain-containing protein [Pseudomonadota bacterium]